MRADFAAILSRGPTLSATQAVRASGLPGPGRGWSAGFGNSAPVLLAGDRRVAAGVSAGPTLHIVSMLIVCYVIRLAHAAHDDREYIDGQDLSDERVHPIRQRHCGRDDQARNRAR